MAATDPCTSTDILKWLPQAFAICIGWVVVHRLSVSRDRDKARREMISKSADQLIEALGSHLQNAHDYHQCDRDKKKEMAIKMAIQDLAVRTAGLWTIVEDTGDLKQCQSAIANVRKASTGTHFEDEHCAPLAEGSEQFQTIAEAVLAAQRSFLILKHKQFAAQPSKRR